MARLDAPVTNTRRSAPAAIASSTAYWIRGLSTMGSISLGDALVAGRKRVPRPATGKTAVRIGFAATYSGSLNSVANGSIRAAVDAFAQILARLEVRHILAGERYSLAGLWIASLARRTEVQREAAESADLDAIALR